MKVRSLVHVTVQVTDVARACRIYREVFGFVELPRPGLDFPGAWFACGDCQLHIVGQAQPDPPSGRHFAVSVEDLSVARSAAEAAGLMCGVEQDIPGTPGGRRFFLTDLDHNRWELICVPR